MRCLHINIRQATFIILSIIVNNVNITEMAGDNMVINDSGEKARPKIHHHTVRDVVLHCPSLMPCENLPGECIDCKLNNISCIYGEPLTRVCSPHPSIKCKGERNTTRTLLCRYCYQTDPWEQECDLKANCNSISSPRATYTTNCTVKGDIMCLGGRTFLKNIRCNWTGGYRWSTALILSVTLGGFGADRFYLGHWQEGIGKLFSFGGLGVWTIIDVILISLHYLGPADGSLYI